jgi:SAM-dependent methyltransferase
MASPMIAPKTLVEEIKAVCFAEGGYPNKWQKLPACPCCGAGPLRPIFKKYGISHSQCGSCDFVCVDPFPPDEVLQKLYAGYYYTLTRELYEVPRIRKDGAHTAYSAPEDVLRGIIAQGGEGRNSGSWLDVGGGIGVFASLVSKDLAGWSVAINEFNPRSTELAKELFGTEILPADPRAIAATGRQFDVISAISVLEHIVQPHDFVYSYVRLLKPSGKFIVVVPHFTHFCAAVARGSSTITVPPYHASLFNESNLTLMLSRCALNNIETRQDGASAFSLLQIADYGDDWDITMPSQGKPAESIQVCPTPTKIALVMSALAEADQKIGDYFGETDGRVFLTAFAEKKHTMFKFPPDVPLF